MERLLLKIYDFFAARRRTWAVIIPTLLFFLFLYGASRIKTDEDIAGFLPYGSSEGGRQGEFIYKSLRMQDNIVILFSADGIADSEQRADALAEAADIFVDCFEEAGIEGVKEPQLRVEPAMYLRTAEFIVENMPYFLEEKDYALLDSVANQADILSTLLADKEALLLGGAVGQNIIAADPLHLSASLLNRLSRMGTDGGYRVIGDYLFSGDTSRIIMTVGSVYGGSETAHNKRIVETLASIADSARAYSNAVEINLIGSPAIAVANAERMRKDTVTCAVYAIALIALLLAWYFRRLKPILLICVPVVFGAVFALALMGVIKVTISAIALSACSVIFGIGVDYALLYSTRLGFTGSSRSALKDVASPMVIGNITTVGAFLSLLAMSAAGMRDFGLFASLALVGAILFVILFLPHWAGEKGYRAREGGWLSKWVSIRPENGRYTFLVIVLLSVILFFFSRRVEFSGDFNQINYMTAAQKEAVEEFNMRSVESGSVAVYAVAEGTDLNQALERREQAAGFVTRALDEKIVAGQRGVEGFLPSEGSQAERIARWNRWRGVYGESLLEAIDKYSGKAGFTSGAFAPFKALLSKEFEPQPQEFFSPLASGLLKGYIMKDTTGNSLVVTILYTPKENVQRLYGLLEEYKDSADKEGASSALHGVSPYAQNDIVEPASFFLFDSFSMTEEMINILQRDFNWVLFICSFLVFGFLWLSFRKIELALIAFLPMALSWIWICGIMGILGIHFNIVNIILATFIFGLGDDYTIFMVEGLEEEFKRGRPVLASYKTGVTLSAATMFIGLGTLLAAQHPALRSLGQVAVIGMVCVVLMAFILPPVLYRAITMVRYKGRLYPRKSPVGITDIAVTVFCLLVFFFASLWYKIKLLVHRGLSSDRFHLMLYGIMKYFALHIPRISFTEEYKDENGNLRTISQEDVDSILAHPAIILCNHQSHLDLLYIMQLYPKLVVITNRRTYHSPVYSDFIRKAGFISIEENIDSQIDKIRKLMQKGFSLVIFPEGTRSEEGNILKFHSGAFYMAEKLQADIIPLIMSGVGDAFPKREFILHRAEVTLRFLPRVPYAQLQAGTYGDKPLKQAHSFQHLYERELSMLMDKK